MGNNSCTGCKQMINIDKYIEHDGPPIMSPVSDQLIQFELHYHFYRRHISYFLKTIREFYKTCKVSQRGVVTIAQLKDLFYDSEALSGIFTDEKTTAMVKALPGTKGQNIDLKDLMCLGILWCQGSSKDKS